MFEYIRRITNITIKDLVIFSIGLLFFLFVWDILYHLISIVAYETLRVESVDCYIVKGSDGGCYISNLKKSKSWVINPCPFDGAVDRCKTADSLHGMPLPESYLEEETSFFAYEIMMLVVNVCVICLAAKFLKSVFVELVKMDYVEIEIV